MRVWLEGVKYKTEEFVLTLLVHCWVQFGKGSHEYCEEESDTWMQL